MTDYGMLAMGAIGLCAWVACIALARVLQELPIAVERASAERAIAEKAQRRQVDFEFTQELQRLDGAQRPAMDAERYEMLRSEMEQARWER